MDGASGGATGKPFTRPRVIPITALPLSQLEKVKATQGGWNAVH